MLKFSKGIDQKDILLTSFSYAKMSESTKGHNLVNFL